MARLTRDDLISNTLISSGTTVSGDIIAPGFVRVDGSLKGSLHTEGPVIVGAKARMKSDITGTNITVGGVVKGNIIASERVTILSTGLVLGDIITKRIQADSGCLVHGKIVICTSDEQWNRAIRSYKDARGIQSTLSGFTAASPSSSYYYQN
ncbi:MAG: polymer-forming cytoskeletal protein [Treponema sp.]|jgi:cytoskeletal protein CcmA (bactofilin family)|nr:polymer-forming cytoskeletal protein [Treponema sp.]